MGDAFLTRRGGASLRRLELLSPPDKLRYFTDEYLDMTGTIVGANFGSFTVPLHETAWQYSPLRALTPSDQAVQITATLGRLTRQLSVPIIVEDYRANLNDNPWSAIARAAEQGIAGQIWNIGDSKFFDLNGTQIEARIVSFNADPLDENDERYNDPAYNGGKKKAAMVFQFFTSPGQSALHNTSAIAGWDTCFMRVNTLTNLFAALPEDLRSAIRLVKKYTYFGYQTRDIVTADRLFLESLCELSINRDDNWGLEKENCIKYTLYANGINPIHSVMNWTRTSHGAGCNVVNHYYRFNSSGNCGATNASQILDYFPMFCI